MPADDGVQAAMASRGPTPEHLARLLRERRIDLMAVDDMLHELGPAAIRPLIEALAESRLRSTRRQIMERLVKLGPRIGPFVMELTSDDRWYVVRNMLALLRETGCEVDPETVERLRAHADPRVRREILQLQLVNPATRDAAFAEALAGSDRHVLRTALQAARAGLPESAVPVLARRVTEPDFPPEFRVISLFLLGRSRSSYALHPLLAFAEGGRTLFGKPKLAAKSPEMLAALGGIARSWPSDRRTVALLEVARASKDEQILNTLHATPAS